MTGEQRIDEHGTSDKWDRGGVYDHAGKFDLAATEDGACARYEICGNVVPANGRMCADCLDAVRARDRERRDGENR